MNGTQYCRFSFERLRPDWLQLARGEQEEHLSGFQFLLTRYPLVRLDHYLPLESQLPCDFVLRWESDNPEALRDLVLELRGSDFYQFVETIKTMSGRTHEPEYITPDLRKKLNCSASFGSLRRNVFIFPISRAHDWWHLDDQTRQEMVQEHVRKGLPYLGQLHRRCYYCEGLDPQQDFIYYIEADDPGLVNEVYEQVKGLRDAQYWAVHSLTLRGVPVTLEEWCEQVLNPALAVEGIRPEPPHTHPASP